MTQVMASIGMACYVAMASVLAGYGCYRAALLRRYYRVKAKRPLPPKASTAWPMVTLQIPV